METISFFLDTVTKLADRLINMEKNKREDKQVLFNEIAKPLYQELEPVARHYIEFFRKARKEIDNRESLANIMSQLKEQRDETTMSRIKVQETAAQIETYVNDQDFKNFAEAIRIFFYGPQDIFKQKRESASNSFAALRQMKKLQTEKPRSWRDGLIGYLDKTIIDLEEAWKSVVKYYEVLKLYSISHPRLVNKRKVE